VRAVNDDWRLRVTLLENDQANTLTGGLAAGELEHDLTTNLKDRVAVSGEGAEVFCYAGAREVLDSVRATIERLADDQKWEPEFELKRWHPAAEEWEDPDVPLPASAGEQAAERAELMEREREEAEEDCSTEFEVRVQCNSHGDAVRLAGQLDAEGLPHARRWRYVLVGAPDEDSAQALAARLRSEAPEGSEVTVEGTAGAALDERPPNIFALFGGLGG
jgi:hypothetical protein